MKKAIAIAVALAGFATVAQAAPKDNTGMQVVNWVGPSITTPVSTVTVSRTTTVRPVTISLVLVRSVVTVNPYLGFEMGYDWLGRMAYKGSVDNGAFKSSGRSADR